MPADVLPLLASRVRERGLGATLRKAFADHVFRHSTSVILEYCAGWGRPGRGAIKPDWLDIVVVRDAADLPPLGRWLAWREADFRAMLAAGKLAIVALKQGEAVGCVWIALSDHHDPASREFYAVRPGEAYHYCWLVDPALRASNIAMPLCRAVGVTLAALGIERFFGVVDRANRASYLILSHFGYRECGVKVLHYVIFGSRWTRIARYDGVLGTVPRAR